MPAHRSASSLIPFAKNCLVFSAAAYHQPDIQTTSEREPNLTLVRRSDSLQSKEVHKMSVEQLEREMNAVGLVHVRTVETLPLQHIVIFEKRN